MKTIKIKSDSFHAKMIRKMQIWPDRLNTCSYISGLIGFFLWKAMQFVGICIATLFIGVLVIDTILALWFSAITGTWIISQVAEIGLTVLGLSSFLVVVGLVAHLLFRDNGIVSKVSQTSTGEILSAWHQNMCRKIEIE